MKLETDPLVGNEDINVSFVASGRAAGVKAGYGLSNKGFRAEAVAYVYEGDASVKFKIFGIEARVGVKGCAACAGGAVAFGAQGEVKAAAFIGGGFFWDIKLK